jgi:peptidoglycan hydrolase-like protein with peptidoglycan-binding domain
MAHDGGISWRDIRFTLGREIRNDQVFSERQDASCPRLGGPRGGAGRGDGGRVGFAGGSGGRPAGGHAGALRPDRGHRAGLARAAPGQQQRLAAGHRPLPAVPAERARSQAHRGRGLRPQDQGRGGGVPAREGPERFRGGPGVHLAVARGHGASRQRRPGGARGPGPDQLPEPEGRATLAVDGLFGPKTEASVWAFQKAMAAEASGFRVDGIVGLQTWRALVSEALSG